MIWISIHKALTGLDHIPPDPHISLRYFNPQGPHGPRQAHNPQKTQSVYFNPQGPHGPRQVAYSIQHPPWDISIHKALTGLDVVLLRSGRKNVYFNPQGPHGPRQWYYLDQGGKMSISIHKALTGLDAKVFAVSQLSDISIHKALTGLDTVSIT